MLLLVLFKQECLGRCLVCLQSAAILLCSTEILILEIHYIWSINKWKNCISLIFRHLWCNPVLVVDLLAKSFPPIPALSTLHNDPALIQSHYPQTSASSSSLPSATVGPVSLRGLSSQALQCGLPLYQPGGSLVSWSYSTPAQSSGSGFAVPMYWQAYYGPSSNLHNQHQAFLRPPHGLSMPSSLQQLVPYPIMTVSMPTLLSIFSVTQSLDFPRPLVSPIVSSSLNVQPIPVQTPQPTSVPFTNLVPIKAPAKMLSATSHSFNLPLVPPLTTAPDKSSGSSFVLDQALQVSSSINLSEPVPATVEPSPSPLLTTQKEDEVVQVSASVLQAPTAPSAEFTGSSQKPGYKKGDFFYTLSYNSPDKGASGGRPTFSEQSGQDEEAHVRNELD